MNADLGENQSSKFFPSNLSQTTFARLLLSVIEWVKQKIHEPESDQQTSASECKVTMDDFRVWT